MKDDIKLNAFGEVDVDYYIDLAKKQRAQVVAEMFAAAGSWFAKLLHVKADAQMGKVAH